MLQLHEFLLKNKDEILIMTEKKTADMAGTLLSSNQLKQGLPVFFDQLLIVLLRERSAITKPVSNNGSVDANTTGEVAIAMAAGKPEEAAVARSAGLHGKEMLLLGYTLSHVVHAYGAMCQSITELAEKKKFLISSAEFHDLNQCLDVAIAGAVTEYQKLREIQEADREVTHIGSLAHELRNALTSASISLQLIKKGTVGARGNTGLVLEKSLKQMQTLIDRSLTEVRLRVDQQTHIAFTPLLVIVDQIVVTAEVEAKSKDQKIELHIDPTLVIEADQQAFHSALSNLIQNALKFTPRGGKIQVRGSLVGEQIIVEVEDECGGLSSSATELFEAFGQRHENREGLGLGLTIAQRAIALNHGTIEVHNLEEKGCIFKIILPKHAGKAAKSDSVSEVPGTKHAEGGKARVRDASTMRR
jgi:signal transduction histidine kinase